MRLELYSDSYWLLAEVRWLARTHLIGGGHEFVLMEKDMLLVSQVMASAVSTIEVAPADLLAYACAFASLAFSFAHGAMVRNSDQIESSDSLAWASLVLEGIAHQLYDASGLKDEYGYVTSKELTEMFRSDHYAEVDIDGFFDL